jgi:hypothetical protein
MIERSGNDLAPTIDKLLLLLYSEAPAAIAREPKGMWLWLEEENQRIKYKYITLISDEDRFVVAWFFCAFINGLFASRERNRTEMVRLIKLMVMSAPLKMRKNPYPMLFDLQDGNIVPVTKSNISSSTLNYVDLLIEMHAAIERAKGIHEPYDEDGLYMNFAGRFISEPEGFIPPALIEIIQTHHKKIEDGLNKYIRSEL